MSPPQGSYTPPEPRTPPILCPNCRRVVRHGGEHVHGAFPGGFTCERHPGADFILRDDEPSVDLAAGDETGLPPTPWHIDADGISADDDHTVVMNPILPHVAAEIVRCVNLCHPPADSLQAPETLLALAVLASDPASDPAVRALRDELEAQERHGPDFVTRGEMVEVLRGLAALVNWSSPPMAVTPIGKLSHAARALLARLDGPGAE